MDKKHNKKSLQYLKKHSTLNSSYNQSKNMAQMEPFENGLSKIFSSPPSHLGYLNNIESLINELGLKSEQHLNFTISCLSKLVRNKNETKIIASYLYLMPDFIKLLRRQEIDKNEQDILKDLLNLAQSIAYQKCDKNTILMRFGDKGSTAYIILDGKVDVLIKSFKLMNVTKNDYLFYLANLLRYCEYGLLNEVINENFDTFPIEIYDSNNLKHLNFNNINDFPIREENIKSKTINNLDRKRNFMLPSSKNLTFTEEKTINNEDKYNYSINSFFKLNEENEKIKEFKNVFTISTNKLLRIFNLKQLDKKNSKLHKCPINEYINRLELVPGYYKICIHKSFINHSELEKENVKDKKKESIEDEENEEKEEKEEKENNENNKINNKSEDEDTIYNLKIFTYIKVATLGKGTLFGELALKDANSQRTGTIISSSECHFTVLSKRVYDNCLKKGAEKYLKELLSFFINLPVFIGISESLFYHKYYNYLSKKIILRGNCIINQGEKPKNIILIKTGIYGLTTRISLFELTKLIYYFINENLKNKGNINIFFDEETKKYNRLLKQTKNMINEAKILMNDNIKFKKYYLSEIFIRVTDISCPDIIGYKEYIGENGLYAFSIETKSPENIIFSLDNKFYSDLLQRNCTVRNNQKKLLEKKIDAMIQRLLIIRNSLVNSFFDNKNEKELSSILIKELENLYDTKLKQKRFLKFKSTEYKFNKKIPKRKKYSNKNKYRNIINFSRNYKINNNANYFHSFNLDELTSNKLKNNINNQSHNKNYIKKISNVNNKINNNKTDLYKTSKNFNSKNNDINEINIGIKKIVNINSKEKDKAISSCNGLREYSSRNILNKNNNIPTELNNSKTNYEQQKQHTIKNEKLFLLNSKFNFPQRIKAINYNSLVWEEIKTKINLKNNNNNLIKNFNHTYRSKNNIYNLEKSNSFNKINNEEIKNPINSGRYSSGRIRFNNKENNLQNQLFKRFSLLQKSKSELSSNKKIRVKSNLIRQIKSPKYIDNHNITIDSNKKYYSPQNESVPKINLRIKKMFSPEEIKFIREINKKRDEFYVIKYHESKLEKYKLDRYFYYNNNLKNRIKLFYNIEKKA